VRFQTFLDSCGIESVRMVDVGSSKFLKFLSRIAYGDTSKVEFGAHHIQIIARVATGYDVLRRQTVTLGNEAYGLTLTRANRQQVEELSGGVHDFRANMRSIEPIAEFR